MQLALRHALHDVTQLLLAHFSVRNADLGVGEGFFDTGGTLNDGFHAIVEVIDLPVAIQLSPHRVDEHRLGVFQNERLHRIAVVRRLLNGGHIADARQRHVQRARDGRRREGQDIHTLGKLLQLLFMCHAEALLLVHDQQPEVLEPHVLLQQLVRTDHEVKRARGKVRQCFSLLCRRAEAREHADIDRKAAKTCHGSRVMLLCQYGRRDENRRLFTV